MIVKKIGLLFLVTCLTLECVKVAAQDTTVSIKAYVAGNPVLKEFYSRVDYQYCWVQHQNLGARRILFAQVANAINFGLQPGDYDTAYLKLVVAGKTTYASNMDMMKAEVRLSWLALNFYRDLAFGSTAPVIGYNNWKPGAGLDSIAILTADQYKMDKLATMPEILMPAFPEAETIIQKILWIQRQIADPSFQDEKVLLTKAGIANPALVRRFFQLGLVDSPANNLPPALLKNKVKQAQEQFSLPADGVLRSSLVDALNIPLETRLQQLHLSLQYYRWLAAYAIQTEVIVVNIPAAMLTVYNNCKPVLQMKIVAGEISKPTPALASQVTEVILYPYWHVPYKIATRELLPAIKRDVTYLDAHNYQVLNSNGKIMDPAAINWRALNTRNFPYLIRQSTGCDNALGLLKLNFYNPYGVYLHDTPNKLAFFAAKRFLSHGCMRMEKSMELGRLVLKENSIAIDTLTQKGCLRNQSPITVKVAQPIPVLVWYNPAGTNEKGILQYYPDIYNRFNRDKKNR